MSSDYKEMLSEFNARSVEFLIVGAHAMAAHGFVRATKDLDIWIRPNLANASRVREALAAFGAPLFDLSTEDLSRPGTVFQIGVPPLRIDILTAVDGLTFEEAWQSKSSADFEGEPIHVLSLADLIRNKRAAARLQDLADVERLSGDRD